MSNNKNMILALALCGLVLFAWQYFVATPQMKAEQTRQAQLSRQVKSQPSLGGAPTVPGMSGAGGHMSREAALKAGGARVAIDTPMLDGSIQLKGAKLDDLRLKKYRETIDPKSPEIVLLAPKSTDAPLYANVGWIGPNAPNDNSVWTQQGNGTLAPGKPITLTFDNGHGQVFTRVIAIDDKYMFTVSDSVANKAGAAVTFYPYAAVAREGEPKETSSFVLHVGFVGIAGDKLNQAAYKDFKDPGTPAKTFAASGGWVGITDKYWMAAVVPPQSENFDGSYLGTNLSNGVKAYQANYRLGARAVAPGASATVTHRVFAGAKVVDILRGYEKGQGIAHFDQAVDWGPWLWVFTRPLFWLLDTFYKFLGNFGLAILGLTVVIKLIFFPLANTSYRSMSKMKKVQPEMERIKQAHKDDPQRMQQETMELYRREKVNPVAGCLPMLIQIPVFFSLYKVLFVTIEMRHTPFYGWIRDLSAADPTSILNLFGLLPFNPHAVLPTFLAFLSIGAWPIIYGVTQWLTTKLNPAPSDPVQAKMFAFMPLIFTVMFATFPAGLVIYYTWNNLLTAAQQYFIMRREGVAVNLLENIRPSKK